MNVRFQTAGEVASSREATDEKWKSCKHCGCYSFRHQMKTQSLTGIEGDTRLKGWIECKNCGQNCQPIKQSLVSAPSHIEENKSLNRVKDMIRRGY